MAREVAASKQLLAKEAEVGALKGEINMLRTQVCVCEGACVRACGLGSGMCDGRGRWGLGVLG